MKQENTQRKCIVSGQTLDKDALLRFTLTPDLQVIPDFKKRLPGKGVYVRNSRKALQTAVEKNLFAKALKQKAKVDETLTAQTEGLLRKHALEAVSLARKAGVLVTGMEKVSESLKKNKIAFILEANDAGEDGHRKILNAAGDIEVFRLFSSEELDKALNKVSTVHAAFVKGQMAQNVRGTFKKLFDFLND